MTEKDAKIIRLIRESKDPEKAMDIALDLLTRLLAGESIESIAASQGFNWEDIKVWHHMKHKENGV